MTSTTRQAASWSSRLLIALLLVLLGAAAATWGLARWDAAARALGVDPVAPSAASLGAGRRSAAPMMIAATVPPEAAAANLAALEQRLARVENISRMTAGSAGRADALLVAFAARRAIDRGVSLGYLETLLADRFGPLHPRAVATIITASRDPVRLDQLDAEYEALGPALKAAGPDESWLSGLRRELGSLVTIRRADQPSPQPTARYERARARLAAGQVDAALAETMRMPGASRAAAWIDRARRYIAVHRALDEIESAALLGGGRTG